MADELEETLDDRLERIQRRAENFRELLKEGDEVTIAFLDGEMLVEESYRSQIQRKHPKLFGRLLSVEAQMEHGWVPHATAMTLAIAFLFGLPLRWWDGVLGEQVSEHLNNWWFYAALPLVLLYLARLVCGRWEKYVYRRNRPALLTLIAAEQLDRDVLLVMLRDENDLDGVVRQLKLDTSV